MKFDTLRVVAVVAVEVDVAEHTAELYCSFAFVVAIEKVVPKRIVSLMKQ